MNETGFKDFIHMLADAASISFAVVCLFLLMVGVG